MHLGVLPVFSLVKRLVKTRFPSFSLVFGRVESSTVHSSTLSASELPKRESSKRSLQRVSFRDSRFDVVKCGSASSSLLIRIVPHQQDASVSSGVRAGRVTGRLKLSSFPQHRFRRDQVETNLRAYPGARGEKEKFTPIGLRRSHSRNVGLPHAVCGSPLPPVGREMMHFACRFTIESTGDMF